MRAIAGTFVLMLCIAPAASAKFGVVLSLSPDPPLVREPLRVLVRADEEQGSDCRMRLLAVAPGIGRQRALDAFVIGGYSVNGPQGNTFHALRPTRNTGSCARLRASAPRRGAPRSGSQRPASGA